MESEEEEVISHITALNQPDPEFLSDDEPENPYKELNLDYDLPFQSFRSKYFSLIEGVNMPTFKQSFVYRMYSMYVPVFLARRLLFVLIPFVPFGSVQISLIFGTAL